MSGATSRATCLGTKTRGVVEVVDDEPHDEPRDVGEVVDDEPRDEPRDVPRHLDVWRRRSGRRRAARRAARRAEAPGRAT
jgi:hypothetical protein